MDPVRVQRESDVQPVVDEEKRVVLAGEVTQRPPDIQELPGSIAFVAELDAPHARGESIGGHVHHAPWVGEAPVRENEHLKRPEQSLTRHGLEPLVDSRAWARSRRACATARLCSARVRENVCVPSILATK